MLGGLGVQGVPRRAMVCIARGVRIPATRAPCGFAPLPPSLIEPSRSPVLRPPTGAAMYRARRTPPVRRARPYPRCCPLSGTRAPAPPGSTILAPPQPVAGRSATGWRRSVPDPWTLRYRSPCGSVLHCCQGLPVLLGPGRQISWSSSRCVRWAEARTADSSPGPAGCVPSHPLRPTGATE